MASFLITGAGRGFGLALTKELVSRPAPEINKIVATVRKPSADLESVATSASGRVTVIRMDVSDEASIKNAVPEAEAALEGKGLDVLINNAGIAPYARDGTKSLSSDTNTLTEYVSTNRRDNLQESFQVNVLGSHWVTRNFLPLLQKGQLKKVVNIATPVGSISLAPSYTFMPAPAYKISEAALHALTVQYSLDYDKEGFSFMALCPGWMKTELGGGDMADLTPEQSAKATLDIVNRPNAETNGQSPVVFVRGYENVKGPNRYDGKNAPW